MDRDTTPTIEKDALIMTTEPIRSYSYREGLEELVASHEERWGPSLRQNR